MKKYIYNLLILSCLGIIFSCSTAQADYDRQVDFSQFKTYNYFSNIQWGEFSAIDAQRFYEAIDAEMTSKGFTKTENPQLIIDIQPSVQQTKRTSASVGIGGGSWGRGTSIGGSVGIPIRTKQNDNQFVIEMVNASNDQMVWQGVYDKSTGINADKDKLIKNSIQKIFQNFPPKNKK